METGGVPQNLEVFLNFSATAEATSKLAISWGFPKPIIKSHPEVKVVFGLVWGSSQDFGFPFNISVMGKANDFNFCIKFGFASLIIKSHRKTQVGVAIV